MSSSAVGVTRRAARVRRIASSLLGGVGEDAAHVAEHVARRAEAFARV